MARPSHEYIAIPSTPSLAHRGSFSSAASDSPVEKDEAAHDAVSLSTLPCRSLRFADIDHYLPLSDRATTQRSVLGRWPFNGGSCATSSSSSPSASPSSSACSRRPPRSHSPSHPLPPPPLAPYPTCTIRRSSALGPASPPTGPPPRRSARQTSCSRRSRAQRSGPTVRARTPTLASQRPSSWSRLSGLLTCREVVRAREKVPASVGPQLRARCRRSTRRRRRANC